MKHILARKTLLLLGTSLFMGACSLASDKDTDQSASQTKVVLEDREPEAATGRTNNTLSQSNQYMVAAANPYAVAAGKKIIEQGGSALDAAVAVQAMLTLVEPQSSGIGGGAFIMYWDNTAKKLYTFDGREVAPQKAHANMFFKDGKPMRWRDAVVGGTSVGVPGVLKALEQAHQEFGVLPWDVLFADTIKQSSEGFIVSPRLAKLIAYDLHPGVNAFPSTKEYFKPQGVGLAEGQVQKNEALAATLSKIAKKGTDVFYKGELAQKMAQAVQTVSINPGTLSSDDFANYEAIKREPMCNPYRVYTVCSMAPPSSGGVTTYQILKLLEGVDIASLSPFGEEFAHVFSQASALAFADRAHYVADLSFLGISAMPLVNENYIASRANKVGVDIPYTKAEAGMPYEQLSFAKDNAFELDSTSHISIVDKQGNAVSMTASIEFMFGSGIMVEGFLLNNQLTDFSINPMRDGKQVLNAVQANKRPRSSMSPTMVFDQNDDLRLVVGSPGGSRIINYVAHTIINVLDFDMDIQAAISAPRITNRNDVTSLEKGTAFAELKAALENKGHKVRVSDLNSGLHGVEIKNGILLGGADPRREGVAQGQ